MVDVPDVTGLVAGWERGGRELIVAAIVGRVGLPDLVGAALIEEGAGVGPVGALGEG